MPVCKRVWKRNGVRRVAWGYSLVVNGKQERAQDAAWTKEDAERALAARLLQPDAVAPGPAPMTFGVAIERYLEEKKKKRTVEGDARNLARLSKAFGAELLLQDVTAKLISKYKLERSRTLVRRDGAERPISTATCNRELAALRHLLKLAALEWEVIDKAPHVRLDKEPEGRIAWLEATEEAALLAACRKSQNLYLADLVTVALETGLRHGELMGLTWDRVDRSRGVIMLERTKAGRRREVPMRAAVDAIFAAMPEPREGRVWPDKSIRRAFENSVAVAGLKDWTFHDCRHHFASWFMMRGGQLESLRLILGHRDIKMTLRYAHLSPGHLRGEMEKTSATGMAAVSEFRSRPTQNLAHS